MLIINGRSATDRPASARGRRRGRGPARLVGALLAAALVAGCGGSSSGGSVALVNSPTTAAGSGPSSTISKAATKPETKPSLLAFAKCIRAHGVPNFPDPSRPPQTGSGQLERAPSGGFTANPNSPAYETASNDCRSLAMASPVSPAQSNQIMGAQLQFAVCMRAHGVPNYPDPTNDGELGHDGAISGVNPSSPAFQSAEQTCSKFLLRPHLPNGGPSAPSAGG